MADPYPVDLFTAGGAQFSPCGRYRPLLFRSWNFSRNPVVFIMLNPSTADANKDDPTVHGCGVRARKWGAGGLIVLNLFQLRSTDPRALYDADDPVGPDADETILRVCRDCDHILAAWGNHGALKGHTRPRCEEVIDLVTRDLGRDLWALRITKEGQPSHPLYLPHDLTPVRWRTADAAEREGDGDAG